MTTQTTLPLSGLRLDTKANVRKIGRGVDPELLASIRAIGIKVPLIVRPNGVGHMVIEGGQRLAVLQELAKLGEIKNDAPVPVVIEESTDAQARETSLATNVIRQAMHPVDEFRAFAALHTNKEQPLDVDAIALRFGLQRKQVEQRLALGSLDDAILDAYRDGKINGETAEAFTLCPNKKAQVTIYNKLVKAGGRIDRYDVKHALKIGQDHAGKLLGIVGQDAYETRGGKVTRDLFGTDHIVSDAALLKAMVEEKAGELCTTLVTAGWAWAIARPDNRYEYGELQAKAPSKEQAQRLSQLRRQAHDLDDDESPEAIKLDTEIEKLEDEVIRNAYSAAQMAKGGCFVSLNDRGDALRIEYGRTEPRESKAETTKSGKTPGEKKKPKGAAKLSQALTDRLNVARVKATKQALVAHNHGNPFAKMLAEIVAAQIEISPNVRYYHAPHKVELRLRAIADAVTPKLMNGTTRDVFDASDYFSGAPKSFTLAAITEAVGADHARKLAGKKRTEIAKFAIANVTKTGWLPKELRTANYDGPGSKKNGKAKRKSK